MNINFNIKEFEKKVTKAERWALLDKKELRKVHRKVSQTYVLALKGRIKNANKTILYTNHSINILSELCDRVILLDKGTMVMMGKPDEVIEKYKEIMTSSNKPVKFY